MMEEFGIRSTTTIVLGMTTYLLGLASGPLILAPLSELYGRRIIYLASMFLYVIFVIPTCVAKNFATILVFRFLAYGLQPALDWIVMLTINFRAFAGSVTISNAPGTIGDIFEEEWRTLGFSIFWYHL